MFQAKSGKELVGFLMNDFLLLAQPPKPMGNTFSFEKYANTTFKLYKKVRLKLQAVTMKLLHIKVVESAYSYIINYCNARKNIYIKYFHLK
jgi:hypothetical protein